MAQKKLKLMLWATDNLWKKVRHYSIEKGIKTNEAVLELIEKGLEVSSDGISKRNNNNTTP